METVVQSLPDFGYTHIAAIGASNTRTAPRSGETLNVYGLVEDDYYIAELGRRFGGTQVDNYGVSGASSAEIYKQAVELVSKPLIPQLVTHCAGTNDVNARGRVIEVLSSTAIRIENALSSSASHRLEKYQTETYIIKRRGSDSKKISSIDDSLINDQNTIDMTLDVPHGLVVGDEIEIDTSSNIHKTNQLLADAGVQKIVVKERRVNNFLIIDPTQQFRNEIYDVATGVFTPKGSAIYVRSLQKEGARRSIEAGLPVVSLSMVEHFIENITNGVDTLGSGKFYVDVSLYNTHFNKAGQLDVADSIEKLLIREAQAEQIKENLRQLTVEVSGPAEIEVVSNKKIIVRY